MKRTSLPAFILLCLFTILTGCGDSCGDIACLPAPTPLEVIVYDTLSVPTTIRRLEDTDSIDVDTVIVRTVATTDAIVTLATGLDSTLTTVDTLERSDTLHFESDLSRIPTGLFRIVSQRGGRRVVSDLRQIQKVEGCCPYSMVGRFGFTLPK